MRHLARALLLTAAAVVSLASASSTSSRPSPAASPSASATGVYLCFAMRSPSGGQTSQCFSTGERCQRERTAAQADGLQVGLCAEVRPVACFQLGGDQSPSNEFCAASLPDCEMWRGIDLAKNGTSDTTCRWK